jgi:hypothetical protein
MRTTFPFLKVPNHNMSSNAQETSSASSNAACKCGAVQIAVSSPVNKAVNCHCGMCREINGSAFTTYAPVPFADLSVAAGNEDLAAYQVTDSARKHWCRNCGTPLFNTNKLYPGFVMLYLGAVRNHAGIVATANIYCSTKLPWVDALSTLKSFDGPRVK